MTPTQRAEFDLDELVPAFRLGWDPDDTAGMSPAERHARYLATRRRR